MKNTANGKKFIIILATMIVFYLAACVVALVMRNRLGTFASVTTSSGLTQAVATSNVVGKIDSSTAASGGEGTLSPIPGYDSRVTSDGSSLSPSSGGTPDTAGIDASAFSVVTPAGDDTAAVSPQHYYRFTVNTKIQRLHLREAPNLLAGIRDWLPKGTRGYIITPTADWSYVTTEDGRMGYCFNGYLDLTEISRDEYPSEFLEMRGTLP